MEKQNSDKLDDLTAHLLQVQLQMQESSLETRQIWQANKTYLIVSRLSNQIRYPVSHAIILYLCLTITNNDFSMLNLHLKWKFPD